VRRYVRRQAEPRPHDRPRDALPVLHGARVPPRRGPVPQSRRGNVPPVPAISPPPTPGASGVIGRSID